MSGRRDDQQPSVGDALRAVAHMPGGAFLFGPVFMMAFGGVLGLLSGDFIGAAGFLTIAVLSTLVLLAVGRRSVRRGELERAYAQQAAAHEGWRAASLARKLAFALAAVVIGVLFVAWTVLLTDLDAPWKDGR